jgi:hypothetical protein
LLSALTAIAGTTPAFAQHPMPPGMSHEEHLRQLQREQELKKRGAAAMGFDQDATSHRFILTGTGGAIVVIANQSADAVSIEAVRLHLREIAEAFSRADFTKPFATHGEVPPGVQTMTERKGTLAFHYEQRDNGGAVLLTTDDAITLEAIHAFLRYQIIEHKTGDPLMPKP